ncbi:unnamed protein product [Spirodela intermedia]|uniref:Uncharacterized protein n=1 Tax=Spirodela intermedia TaxID=51605 RepID=A0A7I8IQ82_SPIIN|nr:unnamed protein product [Spirodela intermedia]CAA6659673.1 unnamed protein product [Spirodela intermedia]
MQVIRFGFPMGRDLQWLNAMVASESQKSGTEQVRVKLQRFIQLAAMLHKNGNEREAMRPLKWKSVHHFDKKLEEIDSYRKCLI